MLRVTYASAAAPGRPNEDYVLAGPSWVVVLDGATPAPGVRSGCRHGVPWLVRTLAAALAPGVDAGEPLPEALEMAIMATMKAHDGTCDLGDPNAPSATVAIARQRGDLFDYLVLCDSAVVPVRRDGSVTVVRDDRLDRLPGGRPYTLELVTRMRNRPGGFWVASTSPEAARRALTGALPVSGLRGVALLTDGVTRLADWYGRSWESLAAGAAEPERLLAEVREQELTRGVPHGKPHDDATAAWVTFTPG